MNLITLLETCFLKTVEISFHASLIIGALLLIRPVAKYLLPPRWVYLLWFIVVVRLFLIDVPSLPSSATGQPLAVMQRVNAESFSPLQVVPPSTSSPDLDWNKSLAIVWLSGAVVLLSYFGFVHFCWARRLAKAPIVHTPEICELLEDCRQEMGVQPVRLVRLAGFASPSITGAFQPVIILPEDFLQRFTPDELRWIFLHEMAHLKRWDLPMQFLIQILQAIHWFNPLVWFAFACFQCDRELACDAHVLDRQKRTAPHDYGHALIKVAEIYPGSFLSPGFLGISEEKTDLQERVEKISQHRRPSVTWIVSGAALCSLLAVIFLTKTRQSSPHEAIGKIQVLVGEGGLGAEMEIIQSGDVVLPAIRQLGLDKRWAQQAGGHQNALSSSEIMDRVGRILKVENKVRPDLTGAFASPNILYITVTCDPPAEAANIANSIIDGYKSRAEMLEKSHQKNGEISDLMSELNKLQSDLEQNQAKLEMVLKDNGGKFSAYSDSISRGTERIDVDIAAKKVLIQRVKTEDVVLPADRSVVTILARAY